MKPKTGQTATIIGSGNVATHLALGLIKAGVIIETVWSSGEKSRKILSELTHSKAVDSLKEIEKNSDFYIISIPDDNIAEVITNMPDVSGIVTHTSGITPLSVISERFINSGVFYPLQTFSKTRVISMKEVPFCIEGNRDTDYKKLSRLAKLLSDKVYNIHSEERRKLHLAAVFVSNFVNHLYHAASDILKENKLPFELLKPLIQEVALKANDLSPEDAQTGPARRNDLKTISTHEKMLQQNPDYLILYQLITNQITKRYYE